MFCPERLKNVVWRSSGWIASSPEIAFQGLLLSQRVKVVSVFSGLLNNWECFPLRLFCLPLWKDGACG